MLKGPSQEWTGKWGKINTRLREGYYGLEALACVQAKIPSPITRA